MSITRRTTVAILVALVPALILSGCGESTPTGPTLSSTKGPAQLLRNEVADRVPPAAVDQIADPIDASVACGDNGMKRAWRSSVLMFVAPDAAWRITSIADDLSGSLGEQGWKASTNESSPSISQVTLKNAATNAVINLTVTQPVDEDGNGATLAIAADGPCVVTDGPDSDEVKKLEGRA